MDDRLMCTYNKYSKDKEITEIFIYIYNLTIVLNIFRPR